MQELSEDYILKKMNCLFSLEPFLAEWEEISAKEKRLSLRKK